MSAQGLRWEGNFLVMVMSLNSHFHPHSHPLFHQGGSSTNFALLREAVGRELVDQSVRSARPLASVLKALVSLNTKFSGSK